MTSSPRAGRRRPVLVPVAAALAAAGVGVTALFGGLKQAPKEPPATVAPGQAIDQGEFRTQFIKAIDTIEPGGFGGPKRYLELVLKVTNLGNESTFVGSVPKPGERVSQAQSSFAASLLRTQPAIRTRYGAEASVLSYGIRSQQLHPGITTTVVVKYELEPAATAPSQVTVDVGSFVYEELGLRDRTRLWTLVGEDEDGRFTPTVAARVSLPVRQARA